MRTGCSGERESFSSSCSAARFSSSTVRSSASQGPLRGSPAPALADRRQARADVADQVDLGARLAVSAFGRDVEPDDLRLLAEAAAEAEPEVHRHADHERHVGALQGPRRGRG